MRKIYEANCGIDSKKDYDSDSEALAAVEAHGSGYVVTFVRDFDGRDRSSAMRVYENGAWRGVYIHG